MALTQKQAQYRYECIEQGSIIYNFHLNLYPNYYTGLTEVQFNIAKQCDKLFIDCSSKKVLKLVINGTVVEIYRHDETHLYLEWKYLRVGTNIVFIEYSNEHNTDQRGLMSFVDVDGKQYLYTTFEAYFAHRVFAVFDQPDLKAPMNLSITCPLSWTKVLSNEHHEINEEFDQKKYLQHAATLDKAVLSEYIKDCCSKQSRMAIFPLTKSMPTYIYCIVLGPFEEIELKQRYNNIPMSLYCSATYLPYVQKMAPYLFETTVQSMRFFQKFFGVPYSFNKYDQVFVHEMQVCAMENAGLVTYHDAQYIWKDDVTLEKALDLADTMVHQLAHHWFGNLTTMKWWDDLWLNESFAQFIAYYALEVIQKDLKIVKFQSSMAQFLNKKSQRGYVCDKSLITHPIRGIVENTTAAQSIFDGITYVKGASTLKQLLYLMGEQNFSAALKNYFTKFAFKNATLNDFIDCLQEKFDNQYGLTLHEWKKVWLEQCSLNQLEPVWWGSNSHSQQQSQKLLTIYQRPYTQKYPLLRPHKIKIALFKQNSTYDVIEVFIPAKQKISIPIDPTLAGQYKAVLLNYEDHAFAKIIIDPVSQDFFIKNVLRINDILTRTYVWRNFYDMVMDGVIPSTKYLELFVSNIGQETSDTILQKNYQNAINSIRLYTPANYREQLYIRLFYFTLNLLQKTNINETNRQITLRDNLCKLANSQLAIRLLYKWYEDKYPPLLAYKLSSSNKWEIVFRMLSLKTVQNKQKLQILERQQKQDKSQAAKLWKLKCSALVCSDEEFDKYYQSLLDPNSSMTIYTKRYLMEGLNSGYNCERLLKYKDRFYESIQKSAQILQSEHLRVFMQYMQPSEQNLSNIISRLQKINLEGPKLQKVKFRMTKKIDFLQKQMRGHQTFINNL